MIDHDRLVRVLEHCHTEGLGMRAALDHAARNGVPPEVLLEHAAPADVDALDPVRPVWWFDDTDEDWVRSLVAFAGGPEDARRILERTQRWAGYDLARHLRLDRLLVALHDALDRHAPVAEIAAIVRASDGALDHVLRDVIRRWPLSDVITSRHLPIQLLRDELPRRAPWPELADAAFGELTDEIAVSALCRILNLEAPPEPALAAVHVRVGLQHRANRPLSELTAFATGRLTLPRWLAVFRVAGFPPELAALAALERGTDPMDAARALRIGGYRDDEILRGLRACGAGDEQVLDALRAAGWHAGRLVGALRLQGYLDPEIREHLRQLGVGAADIEVLLGTALELA